MAMITIKGLHKADVLAALFNASRPMGMGLLQAANGPSTMTREWASELL